MPLSPPSPSPPLPPKILGCYSSEAQAWLEADWDAANAKNGGGALSSVVDLGCIEEITAEEADALTEMEEMKRRREAVIAENKQFQQQLPLLIALDDAHDAEIGLRRYQRNSESDSELEHDLQCTSSPLCSQDSDGSRWELSEGSALSPATEPLVVRTRAMLMREEHLGTQRLPASNSEKPLSVVNEQADHSIVVSTAPVYERPSHPGLSERMALDSSHTQRVGSTRHPLLTDKQHPTVISSPCQAARPPLTTPTLPVPPQILVKSLHPVPPMPPTAPSFFHSTPMQEEKASSDEQKANVLPVRPIAPRPVQLEQVTLAEHRAREESLRLAIGRKARMDGRKAYKNQDEQQRREKEEKRQREEDEARNMAAQIKQLDEQLKHAKKRWKRNRTATATNNTVADDIDDNSSIATATTSRSNSTSNRTHSVCTAHQVERRSKSATLGKRQRFQKLTVRPVTSTHDRNESKDGRERKRQKGNNQGQQREDDKALAAEREKERDAVDGQQNERSEDVEQRVTEKVVRSTTQLSKRIHPSPTPPPPPRDLRVHRISADQHVDSAASVSSSDVSSYASVASSGSETGKSSTELRSRHFGRRTVASLFSHLYS